MARPLRFEAKRAFECGRVIRSVSSNPLQTASMLSYRHAYHAGNHADVLKHLMLGEVIDYFNRKDAPYWYVDTHAGAGKYATDSDEAKKVGEIHEGLGRLAGWQDAPAAIARYLKRVNAEAGIGRFYPGSPEIASNEMRPQDSLRLFELHPADSQRLERHFEREGKRVQVKAQDGFSGLKAVLPPPTRRGIVLIDPSYEIKDDYDTVIKAVDDALKRFSTGCFMVWYPVLPRVESRKMASRLQSACADSHSWLHARLDVRDMQPNGGMSGSGMFVINPPYLLRDTMAGVLPALVERLGTDEGATYVLEGHQR